MPLANLLAALEKEAQLELEQLESNSRAEAEAILSEARLAAIALAEAPTRAAEAAVMAEERAITARARLVAARRVREARERAWQDIHSALEERIAALRLTPGYSGLLGHLVTECRAAAPGGRRLRVDPRDEQFARAIAPDLEIDATLATAGGAELATGHGVSVRNTLEERLANAEPELRRRLGTALLVASRGHDKP